MASLADVARLAGVSKTTVSVVLSRGGQFHRITPECVQRVEAAARQLGYQPNYHMQSIRRGRADTVGLVMQVSGGLHSNPRGQVDYFNALIYGVANGAQALGSGTLIFRESAEDDAIERGLVAMKRRRVDCLILLAAARSPAISAILSQPNSYPIVAVEPRGETSHPTIGLDETEAVRMVVAHLRGLGHRRILWLGPGDSRLDRIQTFREATQGPDLHGECCLYEVDSLPVDRYETRHQIALAEEALSEYIAQHPDPREFTAVACFNDMAGIGAVRACQRAGRSVPKEVSVVGMDDLHAVTCIPQLTTIDHQLFEIGFDAARMAIEMFRAGPSRYGEWMNRNEEVAPKLILRESTAPPPAGS